MRFASHVKTIGLGLLAAFALGAGVSGCIVRERPVVVRPAAPCPGAAWIEGHYNRFGQWRPGHWRCPGVVIVED